MKNCPSNSAGRTVKGSRVLFDLEGSAANLVHFHRFEQRGEIALAKAFILLALDEFEEDGADDGLAENLEQQARVAFGRRAVEQDAARLEALDRFAMARKPRFEHLVIGCRRRWGAGVAEDRKRGGGGK